MDKLKDLADDALGKLGKVKKTLKKALDGLCIVAGAAASPCGGTCSLTVAAACKVTGILVKESVMALVNAGMEKVEEITENAETPEIDESAKHAPKSARADVGEKEEYTKSNSTAGNDPFESGSSGDSAATEEVSVGSSVHFVS